MSRPRAGGQSIAYAESAERAVSILDYRPDLAADYLAVAASRAAFLAGLLVVCLAFATNAFRSYQRSV